MSSAFRALGGRGSRAAATSSSSATPSAGPAAVADPPVDPSDDPGPGRRRRPRLLHGLRAPWWLWVTRAVLAVVAVFVVLSLVTIGEVWWAGVQDQRPRSDALVVLGASQYNGRPSEVFQARLDHAAELYRAGVAPLVITVGGKIPGDHYTEAGVGATYLEKQGVPTSAVLAVPEGRDTLESLIGVAGEMNTRGLRRAVIVTDRWHSLRSVAMARDLGLTAHSSPTVTGPANRGLETQVRYVIREAIGYRFYEMFHRATPSGVSRPAV
ncbi:YdcF family protein [Frankia sp. AgB1.9]|uniref:YdcF family protein n=1 Tax=unclassified Frankia TaxID=2632575 RepID=UPI001933B2C9|nr:MULTISPECIES: YdcF family protein [unclassified Frankia]MBL7487010.1 YdcF family protein [Frankia sp. AgW1.1]MBL7552036.1 YdcF family protein [Frankia sp. AgB1.9]MBL7623355.1 YdcF family protein [Frankia sp. AgB1.8]